ncbi:helix-turn-helix domain-containing protein [Streptosporangium sp. NPDC004631]
MNDDTTGAAQHGAFDWAWAQPVTNNPGARVVLLCVARRVDGAWECTASQEEIAADALLSARSVRRYLEQLEADGHIQRRKRFDERGHRLPDLCRLNPGKSLPANLAGRQVSPVANLAGRESDHRPDWPVGESPKTDTPRSEPVANLDGGEDGLPANLAGRQVSPVANLAGRESDHRPDWPVGESPKTDTPRSEPVANLDGGEDGLPANLAGRQVRTSGQIGRAISSSPSENYEKETSSSRPQPPAEPPPAGPPREDVERLCNRLLSWLIKKDYRQRPQSVSDGWRDAARKLLDLDEIPLQEAIDVLDWSQRDGFWTLNINSMPTFRKQYGQLEMKSRGPRSGGQVHQPAGTPPPRRSTTDERVAAAQALKHQPPDPGDGGRPHPLVMIMGEIEQ